MIYNMKNMVKVDLQEAFTKALSLRYPKKTVLVEILSNIISIEKDGIYRRLSGKINFTINEMATISLALNIPIDHLINEKDDEAIVSLPFILREPLHIPSMDILLDSINHTLERVKIIGTEICGNVSKSLPIECYLHSPLFSKFMFFRLGHYFVGTQEFKNFSQWETPERLFTIADKIKEIHRNFESIFYIMDEFVFLSPAIEVLNFHRMQVITDSEKNQIRDELYALLDSTEQMISGNTSSPIPISNNRTFYISPIPIGFDINYFLGEDQHLISFYTDFSLSLMENNPKGFFKLKEWVDSFRNISTSISDNGLTERTRFFNFQRKLISQILG